ncbi:hypothetical protein SDC9_115281 [bioreactor metagenome]|uniref:Uncharacterized protein n=1 Tax=bioreactor metagenome TaxID=1076179 RepID=A0A645BSE5_9ZZZZ
MVHDAGAAGCGQELGAETQQSAGGHHVLHPHPAGAVVGHLLEHALAGAHQLGDRTQVLLGHIHREPFGRLLHLAVDLAGDHLGLADGQLETLAAHHLDQHGQLQLAAALDLPGVGALGRQQLDRHIADQLLIEAVLQQSRGHVLARPARQRRGIDADRHRDRRLVDMNQRQRPRLIGIGERLADGDLGDAGDGDDVAGACLIDRFTVQRPGHQQFGQFHIGDRPVAAAPGHGLATLDGALDDPAQRQSSEIGGRVEVRDMRLQRGALGIGGGRDVVADRLEQLLQRLVLGQLAVRRRRQRCSSGFRGRVDDREVENLGLVVLQQVEE